MTTWARIWNCGIRLWWYRLWVRADEFHPSLMIDDVALAAMSLRERRGYLHLVGQGGPLRKRGVVDDLYVRRQIAHERGRYARNS